MYVFELLKSKILVAFFPMYIRTSLIGGSIVLWLYVVQVISGLLLGLVYSWVFDTGLPGVIFFWWETFYGSFLARLHSEFGNLVFFMLYIHILTKIWTSANQAEADHTWLTGAIIFIYTYVAGITGAIMPCSILAEVTATVIGNAVSSLSFINFEFLETLMIPGMGLTDDTMSRVFLIHALFPILALLVVIDHLNNLHCTEYTDEDEMEVIFMIRYEYWHEFIWVEIGFWFELLCIFVFFRFNADLFWPDYMIISYAMSNFEYWPISEEIDFVLAIPHWYLRPLMSSLVLIPHHYLGFFYVIICFLIIILLPWFDDNTNINLPNYISEYLYVRFSMDLNLNSSYIFFTLVLLMSFATLIVPTGRYFVFLGSSEILVLAFWFIIISLILINRIGIYTLLLFYHYNT